MARRHRIDFHKPLAGPFSKVVYHCYASHGKGFGGVPPWRAKTRSLCINLKTREVKWADSCYTSSGGIGVQLIGQSCASGCDHIS